MLPCLGLARTVARRRCSQSCQKRATRRTTCLIWPSGSPQRAPRLSARAEAEAAASLRRAPNGYEPELQHSGVAHLCTNVLF